MTLQERAIKIVSEINRLHLWDMSPADAILAHLKEVAQEEREKCARLVKNRLADAYPEGVSFRDVQATIAAIRAGEEVDR